MKKLKFVIVFGLSVVLDLYQIIRHKKSYIFSIFECSENGSFMDTVIKNKNRNGYFYFLFWCLIIRHYSNIWIRMKLDTQAAYAFSKRLHKQFGEP